MTAPPIDLPELSNGIEQVRSAFRDVVDGQPKQARAALQRYINSDEMARSVAAILVPEMDRRFAKKYWPRIILGVGGLFILTLVLAVIGINQLAVDRATNDARFQVQDTALQRSQDTIVAFRAQLDASNKDLVARGLPPVPGPAGVIVPGTPDQAKLINAAAVASTLTKVDDAAQGNTGALAKAVAKAVADYVGTNPVTVPPDLIINGVVDYMTHHPAPAGPPGEKGAQGDPPTAEAIRAAFRDEVAVNPQLLCPLGGTYGQQLMMLASGQVATQYGCFGPTSDPQPVTPSADPGPP